jgi:tetratricopeptide (TPR) repeat protein
VLRKIIESYGTRRVKEAAQFHHRLGKALEGMGDEDGAMAAYDAAFKIDLTNVGILRDLGKLCHRRGDYDRAQKTFRALLLQKLDANAGITKADVYFYLGDLSAKQGDARKAKSMLQRALAEDKEHAEAKALLDTL